MKNEASKQSIAQISNTKLVHADREINKPQHGGVHEPTNNSVLFEFDDVADLEAVFQGKKPGHVYSRSSSGSAVALQNILAQLDNGVAATTFATGMAAISALMFSLLRAGDHIVVSHFLFGNTRSFFDHLQNFNIEVSYVDVTVAQEVETAITENTKMVFCETIANPGTQVADLIAIGKLCQQCSILFVVDNTMTPCVMFNAKQVGASLLTTSLTKYVAGHGNVLGGVVVDLGTYDWTQYNNIEDFYKHGDNKLWGITQIRKKGLRDMGATLAPQSAHMISVGLETLAMRMRHTCNNALDIARFLNQHESITKVNYPGLNTHPHHERATQLFDVSSFASKQINEGQSCVSFGGILSFELAKNIDMRAFLNALNLIISATHLGDTRTLALPVSTTIFYENGQQRRKQMGISETLIRLSIGIEESKDIILDIQQALLKCGN